MSAAAATLRAPRVPTANRTGRKQSGDPGFRKSEVSEILGRHLRGAAAKRFKRARVPNVSRSRSPRLAGDFAQAVADGVVDDAVSRLEMRIRAHLEQGSVTVTMTDNRYTMISVRREQRDTPHYQVRLHHMFADAGPPVTRALALYISKNESESSDVLGDYIDARQHRVRPSTKKNSVRLVTQGQCHDIQAMFDEINEKYFGGLIDARITWGQKSGRVRRRDSIKMGSYSVEDRLIRIHRSLDRAFIPRFFVEWVVYHEMLHQVHIIEVIGGRRQFHPPAFLAQEAEFEFYPEARRWERAHIDALLTY